jgi:hypothetical protein
MNKVAMNDVDDGTTYNSAYPLPYTNKSEVK